MQFYPQMFQSKRGNYKIINAKSMFEEATLFFPTKVFLQVGDNDINMTSAVAEVVSGIQEIVIKISSIKSVKKIVIGNLFRKIISENMFPSKYNSMVCDINTNLQKFYSDRSITF